MGLKENLIILMNFLTTREFYVRVGSSNSEDIKQGGLLKGGM